MRANHRSRGQRTSQPRRYEPVAVYRLAEYKIVPVQLFAAEQVKASGVDLPHIRGPWRASERRVARPGRTSLHAIPVITNLATDVVVDTKEHAVDVAGLLNWCGVDQLDPVPDLAPPTP